MDFFKLDAFHSVVSTLSAIWSVGDFALYDALLSASASRQTPSRHRFCTLLLHTLPIAVPNRFELVELVLDTPNVLERNPGQPSANIMEDDLRTRAVHHLVIICTVLAMQILPVAEFDLFGTLWSMYRSHDQHVSLMLRNAVSSSAFTTTLE